MDLQSEAQNPDEAKEQQQRVDYEHNVHRQSCSVIVRITPIERFIVLHLRHELVPV